MNCPNCKQPIPAGTQVACPSCQSPLQSPSGSSPAANPYAKPVNDTVDGQPFTPVTPADSGDPVSVIVPYKNPKALIAYYLAIAGGLPLIGLPFAIVAFVLGCLGLRDRKRKPEIRGAVHAWIGIGCGGLFSLLWMVLVILVVVGLAAQ